MEMEKVFDQGYDSCGWAGPPRGTLCDEAEEVAEESLLVGQITNEEGSGTTKEATKTAKATTASIPEPRHVDIDDKTLGNLTVAMSKHELTIRKVSFRGLGNKKKLQERLTGALAKKVPVYSSDTLKKDKDKQTSSKKKPDDMSAFVIGAKWKLLTPDIDVGEPVNESVADARALTVPLKDANIQPKPK